MQMASGFKQTAKWLNGTARRRLILWSISFWVVATSVLCFTFLWVGQGQLLQESRNRNVQLAAFVGRDVNAQVNGITGNIRQFTQHLGMLDPQLDEQANAVLGLRLSSSVYRGVYYFKSDGALLFSLNDPAAALPAIRSSREIVARSVFSVQDVISRVCAAARNTGFSVSEPAYTPLEFTPVLYMGIPLTFSSGESRVVVYEIDLTDIWRRIGSVTVGQTGIAYAVSRTGVIITHPEGSYIGLQASREVRPVLSSYEGYVDYVEPVSRKRIPRSSMRRWTSFKSSGRR